MSAANAVARVENLEFLIDVVPKTTTYRTFKQKQTTSTTNLNTNPTMQRPNSNGLSNGQSTLDTHMGAAGVAVGEQQATNGASRPSPEVQVPVPVSLEAMDVDVVDVDDDENEGEDGNDEDGEEGSMHTANDELEPLEGGVVVMEEN